eukprot:INCI916.1.p1 GENE.INCI916.1~~INCI916.1.p1  ORF type:complete len:187 (-),score=31.20 INCI916.1:493-1053(-)
MDTSKLSIENLRKVRDQTSALKDQYFPGFNKKIAAVPLVGSYVDTLGRRLNLSNVALVVYAGLTSAVLATWGLGTTTLCTIGGFVFPAFQTLRAHEVGDFEQWISYWLIFTALNVLQGNTYVFEWIPFFDGLKLGFLLFCALPHTRGAEFIFHTFFKKFIRPKSVSDDSDGKVAPVSQDRREQAQR